MWVHPRAKGEGMLVLSPGEGRRPGSESIVQERLLGAASAEDQGRSSGCEGCEKKPVGSKTAKDQSAAPAKSAGTALPIRRSSPAQSAQPQAASASVQSSTTQPSFPAETEETVPAATAGAAGATVGAAGAAVERP